MVNNIKALLVRPKAKRQLSNIAIKVEPLELELLANKLETMNIAYGIKDCLLGGSSLCSEIKKYKPAFLIFTSYITTVDEIKKQSIKLKRLFPDLIILVGGPHAMINYLEFKIKEIDAVIHSGGIDTIISLLTKNDWNTINGIMFQKNNTWKVKDKVLIDSGRDLIPFRKHFEVNRKKWHYLERKEIALVKTAFGCPYACDFCYCRLMEANYYMRDMNLVLNEIQDIQTNQIWIVDDTFLIDINRIQLFIDGIKSRGIKKHFIIYSRADFIVSNPELMIELKDIGVDEIIIGLEAVSDSELDHYHKEIGLESNRLCIEILHKAGIHTTGLFIFPLDANFQTVKNNLRFIKETKLYNATFSVFTPLKGTKLYEVYKDKIVTRPSRYYDFLHLVLKPEKISGFRFMIYFYFVSIGAFYYMLKNRLN